MINKKVKAAIKKLLSKDRKLIRMKDLRLLVKSNEELSDIKLTGKGRTKIAIVSDLESRIKQKKKAKVAKKKTKKKAKELQNKDVDHPKFDPCTFEIDVTGHYGINHVPVWLLAHFIEDEEDKHFATKMDKERIKKDFKSWEDVEQRIDGFKKDMMKHSDIDCYMFGPNLHRGSTFCTFEHESNRYECPNMSEKEFHELIKSQKNFHSSINTVDRFDDANEKSGFCISLEKINDSEFIDPRTPQKPPHRSGNIVLLAAFDKKNGFLGHGSGCLIDEKHVLTCAHNFHHRAVGKYRWDSSWSVHLHDGSLLGRVKYVAIPREFPIKDDFTSTKGSKDIAVLTLYKAVKSKFPYPVFGLAWKKYEHPKKGAYITIDGYPGNVNHLHQNGWNEELSKYEINLNGAFGKVTMSGLDCKSFRSLAFVTAGTSGAPAMLCDEKGHYVTNKDRPIIVAVAVNLGGEITGDSTVCVPMKPWTLAFISDAIGYKVNVENEWTRRKMVRLMNLCRTPSITSMHPDDDVEMKCDN